MFTSRLRNLVLAAGLLVAAAAVVIAQYAIVRGIRASLTISHTVLIQG